MARRTLNRRELRAEAEAAEAMGLNQASGTDSKRSSRSRSEPSPLRSKPAAGPRMRLVWAVCDIGGRTAWIESEVAAWIGRVRHGRPDGRDL